MSSSNLPPYNSQAFTSLRYDDVAGTCPNGPEEVLTAPTGNPHQQSSLNAAEVNLQEKLTKAIQLATAETEKRLAAQYETKLEAERKRIAEIIRDFQDERNKYYGMVEAEIVQLALAIAAKILHRESQVDRMLLAGLVRVAIENLQHRSNVVVRVHPDNCDLWRDYFNQHLPSTKVDVLEDSQLDRQQCKLETELGTADMSIDAQLKEVEQGFFDLLAQRPETK